MQNLNGAARMLVCGGEVVESSKTLRNYPSREKLMALGEESGFVPFVFVKAPLIEEESAWAALPHADFYPTLPIIIGARECAAENTEKTRRAQRKNKELNFCDLCVLCG